MVVGRTAVGRRRGSYAWAPGFVLLVSMIGVGVTAILTQRSIEQADEAEFSQDVVESVDAIEDRLGAYIALLRATAALFASDDEVTADEFKAFVDRLELSDAYPGIQGVGFSVRYRPEDRERILENIRTQLGNVQKVLYPDSNQDERHTILYLRPLDMRNQAAMGYDMYSEATRREAMRKARDSGKPVASGKVILVQELEDARKQAGFLIYVPVYEEGSIPPTVDERRERLVGFAYAPFRADDLLRGIFNSPWTMRVRLRVYDGEQAAAEQLMHDSRGGSVEPDPTPRFTTTKTTSIAQRPWTVVVSTRPGHRLEAPRRQAVYVLIAGAVIAILLTGVTWVQVRARTYAEQSATRLRDSQEALRLSEERFRRIFDHAGVGIVQADSDGRIIDVNDRLCGMLGYDRADLPGQPRDMLVYEEDWAREQNELEQLVRGEIEDYTVEKRYVCFDGSTIWVRAVVSAVRDELHEARYFIVVVEDISERKRAEERQTLLIEELNHRVKNTLAVVLSIASQTLERSESPDEFAPAFEGRIRAMARAHALLTRRQWRPTSISDLIGAALTPHERESEGRVDLEGPEVLLEPDQALSLSAVLHELATNAAKYGALSAPAGRINVRWERLRDDGQSPKVCLRWREHGGPPVTPPTRRGFGSHLVERCVSYELQGETRLSYDPEGFFCELLIPAPDISADAPSHLFGN